MLILLFALAGRVHLARGFWHKAYSVGRIALFLYTAVFAVQMLRRNPIWRNEFTLAQAMVQEAPESAGGHLNFGSALSNAGRKQEAIEQFRAAIEINPDYVGPHDQLAFALIDQGRPARRNPGTA